MQPSNSAKRNAPAAKTTLRPEIAKKRRLSRTSSSLARLQSNVNGHKDWVALRAEKGAISTGGDGKGRIFLSPHGSDSDKENWSPDEEGDSQPRQPRQPPPGSGRRPLPSGTATAQPPKLRRALGRGALQESQFTSSLLANHRANTAPVPSRRTGRKGRDDAPLEIFEDSDRNSPAPRVADDEVERFMRGEVSPSKKGDVDAVAGLLSLSQGNWR